MNKKIINHRKQLTTISLVVLAAVFIGSLIALVILNNNIQTNNFWLNQQEKLMIITRNCIEEVDQWAVSKATVLDGMANEILSDRLTTGEEYKEHLSLVVRQNPEIQVAYLILDDGTNYLNDDFVFPDNDDWDFLEWTRICKEAEGEIIFTEPYYDLITGSIVISCLKAVTVTDGIAGVIGIDVPIATLVEKADKLKPSQNGGAYLVSSQFKVMTYYVDPTFLPRFFSQAMTIDVNETLDDEGRTPRYIVQGDIVFLNAFWVLAQVDVLDTIDKYAESDGIIIEYINDYDGVEKYEAMATIPSTGWLLGVNIPLSDYDEAVQKTISDQNPIIFIAILMFVISIATALIMIYSTKYRQALQRDMEIAQVASQTKTDFLSRMSHEMRTPMNAIIGMAKIADNTNDITKLKYCISTIESSSEHLLGIINDILDMSKIEAGKLELYNAPMNVEKMLMKICNLMADKTDQKGQHLNIVLGENMGINYVGDDLRLSQVITNLMSNAVKFTPEGGRITLSVDETAQDGNIGTLRFSVSDNGIGMNKEQTAKLFNSFEQTSNVISRQFGGTGLGLAISKNIIEKMGGRVWVESEPSKGSTFTFEVKLEKINKKGGGVIFDGISPSDLKILVVDDNIETRKQLRSITERFGILTEEADSGKKAVYLTEQAFETQKPYDVIFIDYDMPETNGIETARDLSARIDKNTIIIMTSFLTWSKIEREAASVGVKRFISKPLFPSSVLDAINNAIGKTAKALDIKAQKPKISKNLENVHILLAEDIEINREIFVALLESTKINIDTAENGRIAVQKFKENEDKYDLIMMDIQMPEMDGYEATKAIRSLNGEKAKSIPIIAMTANAFKEDVERCLEHGMNDHIAKPIDENIIIEKINLYLKIDE